MGRRNRFGALSSQLKVEKAESSTGRAQVDEGEILKVLEIKVSAINVLGKGRHGHRDDMAVTVHFGELRNVHVGRIAT